MHTAEISYDELDNLCVEIENPEYSELIINEEDIIYFLNEINKIKFKSVRIHKNSLRLVKDDREVIIRDIDRFCKKNGFAQIPFIANQVKSTIAKYNKERAKRKRRNNRKFGKRSVVAAGIVVGALAVTPFLTKNLFANSDVVQNQSNEEQDEDMLNSIILATKISNNVNYTVDDLKEDIEENEAAQEAVEIGETPLAEQVAETPTDDIGHAAYLDYQLSTDSVKRENAYNNYHELVERFSAKWGMSFNLVMAILTQESGGYETNLMQIEFDDWDEQIIKVFNFEANRYDYFVLTNNPEKWADQNVTCITQQDLDNPITNISIGCVLLRKSAEYMDYHVLAAVQCYNLGPGNMNKVLDRASEETGQTRDEMLADQENISFYQFTSIVNKGDPEYLSNIFAFLNDYGETITFKHFGENHEIVEEEISIFSTQQLGYH